MNKIENYFTVEMCLENLPEVKKDFLKNDMEHFILSERVEMYDWIEKIKNDRNIALKLMRMAKTTNVGLEMVHSNLDIFFNVDLMKSKVVEEGNRVFVYFSIWDGYFSFFEQLKSHPLFRMALAGQKKGTKKGMVEFFEKQLRKTYDSHFVYAKAVI